MFHAYLLIEEGEVVASLLIEEGEVVASLLTRGVV